MIAECCEPSVSDSLLSSVHMFSKEYGAVVAAGGVDLEHLEARSRAARLAHSVGGLPFGVPAQAPPPQPLLQPDDFAIVPYDIIDPNLALDLAGRSSLVAQQILHLRNKHSERVQRATAEQKQLRQRLGAWEVSQRHDMAALVVPAGTPAAEFLPAPSGMNTLPFDHSIAVAPLKIMTELLDMGTTVKGGWQGKGQATMLQALELHWQSIHRMACHKHVPKLGTVPVPSISTCFHAGFCLHGLRWAPCRRSVAVLIRVLLAWLSKGTTVRKLYERGAMCVRVFTLDAEADLYLHLGEGNLKTSKFTACILEPLEQGSVRALGARAVGSVACRCQCDDLDHIGQSLWRCFSSLDWQVEWRCEAWRLHSSDSIVDGFVPGVVDLEMISPMRQEVLWRPWRRNRACGVDGGRVDDNAGVEGLMDKPDLEEAPEDMEYVDDEEFQDPAVVRALITAATDTGGALLAHVSQYRSSVGQDRGGSTHILIQGIGLLAFLDDRYDDFVIRTRMYNGVCFRLTGLRRAQGDVILIGCCFINNRLLHDRNHIFGFGSHEFCSQWQLKQRQ